MVGSPTEGGNIGKRGRGGRGDGSCEGKPDEGGSAGKKSGRMGSWV